VKLLAIDTSGALCSAALFRDGALSQRLEQAPRRHGELILSMIDALLNEAELAPRDLDALAFGRGPGSFTGLRIAVAVIQGVAFGAGLPVVGVSTLAALAQGCRRSSGADRALCAFDARMGEVYWGAYQADEVGLMRPLYADRVCAPDAVWLPANDAKTQPKTGAETDAKTGGWCAVGSGWSAYHELLMLRVGGAVGLVHDGRDCEAQDIAVLAADAFAQGLAVPAEQALPVYLRNQVTAVPSS
jgi:tRNA threonylcarbamoyladenosine biosynthesis protein TsaB